MFAFLENVVFQKEPLSNVSSVFKADKLREFRVSEGYLPFRVAVPRAGFRGVSSLLRYKLSPYERHTLETFPSVIVLLSGENIFDSVRNRVRGKPLREFFCVWREMVRGFPFTEFAVYYVPCSCGENYQFFACGVYKGERYLLCRGDPTGVFVPFGCLFSGGTLLSLERF